ncbi:MAG TPA: hypothetical protein VGG71_13505 [Chitinophagaceae bacterium]|jgi:hypothetical protein
MQTLQTVLNASIMSGKLAKDPIFASKTETGESQEHKEYQKTFHQKELDRKAVDPQNTDHLGAVALGKARTMAFMQSATNPHDKNHEKNFERFKMDFGLDARNAEDHFVSASCDELNAHPFDLADPTYEKTLMEKFRPTGDIPENKQKFYDNFCNALREKWDKVGYKGDEKFVKEYTGKYCLTSQDHLSKFKDFQPRK